MLNFREVARVHPSENFCYWPKADIQNHGLNVRLRPKAVVRVTALLVLILVVNVTALLKGGFKIVGDSVNTQHHSFYERQSMVVKVFLPVVLNFTV